MKIKYICSRKEMNMQMPLLLEFVAIVFCGCLWHDRSALDLGKDGSPKRRVKETSQTAKTDGVRLAQVKSVRPRSSKFENVPTPVAHGAAE